LGIGGAERQAVAFAKYLREVRDFDVQVWAFEEGGGTPHALDAEGIPLRSVPIWPSQVRVPELIRASLRAAFALKKAKVDVILPYMTPANILCCSSWRLTGAMTCVWNQRNGGIERFHLAAERFAAHRAPILVANSEQGGNYLVDGLGARRDRVHVIRNAALVDPPRDDRAAWRSRLGVSDSAFVVTMVANLHRWKDHETLLRSWAVVCAELEEELLLVLAGNRGETFEELERLTVDLEISQRVLFLGLVSDVAGLLAASDASVLLNRMEEGEGCPNAIIESMVTGLPVVASDIGGSREVLGPDLKAWLAPPLDVRAVADRLLALARNDELRKKVGETARRRALTEMSKEATFGRYAELLGKIVNDES